VRKSRINEKLGVWTKKSRVAGAKKKFVATGQKKKKQYQMRPGRNEITCSPQARGKKKGP